MAFKVISYVLYKDNEYYEYYERGIEYNIRLAKLMLPDYEVIINYPQEKQRCLNMMYRFHPAYHEDYNIVLCRDSDSLITWREVKEIRKWEASGKNWHGINDNPAHSIPMMGGMIGFKTEALKKLYPTFESLTEGWDLSQHGSDQNLIMQRLYPKVYADFYHSLLTNREPQPDSNPFWESDLVQRYIGSAGYNEMEVKRFLKRFE
jgi:hypothetical protein